MERKAPEQGMCPLIDDMIDNIDCMENADVVMALCGRSLSLKGTRRRKIGARYAANVDGTTAENTGFQ